MEMLFFNLTSIVSLLPFLQFPTFSSAAEQKVLNGGKASPLNSKFEKLVYENLDLWKVPGVAVGVVDGDSAWSEVREYDLLVEQFPCQVTF